MAKILLGVTGSVAAVKTPDLYETLRAAGHAVRVVATEPALHFFDPTSLAPSEPGDGPGPVYRDADEWAGLSAPYRRGDPVLHIEFRKWADLLVVAPLDANTLAKFALGLSDNFLTCVFRAWDFTRPIVLAPAMNTLMWQSPVTLRHLRLLLSDRGDADRAGDAWTLDEAPDVFARHAPGLVLIPPQAKRLACGDFGTGAMAEVATVAEAVRRWAAAAGMNGRLSREENEGEEGGTPLQQRLVERVADGDRLANGTRCGPPPARGAACFAGGPRAVGEGSMSERLGFRGRQEATTRQATTNGSDGPQTITGSEIAPSRPVIARGRSVQTATQVTPATPSSCDRRERLETGHPGDRNDRVRDDHGQRPGLINTPAPDLVPQEDQQSPPQDSPQHEQAQEPSEAEAMCHGSSPRLPARSDSSLIRRRRRPPVYFPTGRGASA